MLLDQPTSEIPSESPNLFKRFGEGFLNLFPEIGTKIQNLAFAAGFREPGDTQPEPLPEFDIPPPKNIPETLVDVGAGLAKAIPVIMTGEKAGGVIASVAGLGARASKAVELASGFGLQGSLESSKQGLEDATLGAGFGIAEHLPTKAKLIAAPLIGAFTGATAYERTGSAPNAIAQGVVNTALPFLLKGRRVDEVDSKVAAPPIQSSVTPGAPPVQLLFKSAKESARAITGEVGHLDEPASSVGQLFRLKQDLASQEAATTEPIATLQKTPLDVPVRIGDIDVAFKEDMDAALKATLQKQKEAGNIPTKNLEINASRQLKMSTVLHPDDSEMAMKAANKLGLKYGGESEGQLHFAGDDNSNFVVPVGSTMKDLRNKFNDFQTATEEKVATLQKETSPWWREEMIRRGLNPARSLNDVDLNNPSVREAIKLDPTLTQIQKDQILKTGSKTTVFETAQPLARRGEEGYIESNDVIAMAKQVVGDKEFARIAADRAKTMSPAMEPIATENAARKIVAEEAIKKGGKLNYSGRSKLMEELGNEQGVDIRTESEKLDDTLNLLEVEKENASKARKQGLKLKPPNLEEGFVTPELALNLGRYVASPIVGAAVAGALSDDDHRVQNALLGAIAGLGVGHFGPSAVVALLKGVPETIETTVNGKKVITPNSVVKGVKNSIKETAADIKNVSAARAATRADGTVTAFDKTARWLQKNFGFNLDEARIAGTSRGYINVLAEMQEKAMNGLTRAELTPNQKILIEQFVKGNYEKDISTFIKEVGNKDIARLAITARSTDDAFQSIIQESMAEGELKQQVLDSKGKYLTRVFRAFTDPKWLPNQDDILKNAEKLEGAYGGMEERVGVIHQYLHEAKAARDMFRKGGVKHGEGLGQILARKEDLTPEFRQLLGEYTDPIEELAVTGVKLMNGARVASFLNEAADGVKSNGLKFAYQSEEIAKVKQNLAGRIAAATDHKEITTLQNQLSDLRRYVFTPKNENFGRLSQKWVDVHIHDDLATYDSVITTSSTRVGEIVRQTNNLFRYGHVALNPLQYARQVLNMPLLGMMAKTFPTDWYAAGETLVKGGEDLTRLQRLGIVGADYIQGQFRQDMNEFVKGKLDQLLYSNFIGKGLRGWEQIFRGPDLTIRVAAFQRAERLALQRGMTAAEAETHAINYANRYTMNYSAAPPGLVKARNYPFTNQFLTFAYEAGRIAYNLAEDAVGLGPEKRIDLGAAAILTGLASTPFILQAASEVGMSDQDKSDWEKIKNLGPTYARSNFRFYTGRNERGDMTYVDFTPLIIHDSWTKMLRDAVHGDVSAFRADNPMFGWENTPLLNVAAKQVSGTDYHTGEKLNSFGARLNSVRRDLAPSIFGSELDRWAAALTPNDEGGLGTTSAKSGRNISWQGILFSYLTSIRSYSSNPDYMIQRAIAGSQEQIKDSAMEYKRIMYSNASDNVKEAAQRRFVNQQEQIFATLQKQID